MQMNPRRLDRSNARFSALLGLSAVLIAMATGACLLLSGPSGAADEAQDAAAQPGDAGDSPATPGLQVTEQTAAALPPTSTPPPLASSTVPPPTDTAAPACTDLAVLVYDVTVPDNTRMPANRQFAKAWRLQNAGSCTWTLGYALVFDSGARMGGPDSQALTEEVQPGAIIDLSVILTTPGAAGTYRGNWRLRNEAGTIFALADSEPFHVQVVVNP